MAVSELVVKIHVPWWLKLYIKALTLLWVRIGRSIDLDWQVRFIIRHMISIPGR